MTNKRVQEQAYCQLTLTKEQADILQKACEMYARVRMGQFSEIIWCLLDIKTPTEEYCKRRDEAERLLYEARKHIYPDLFGRGHSYGIGKFEDADIAFDIHQVLRYKKGDQREPFSYRHLPEVKLLCCENKTENGDEEKPNINKMTAEEINSVTGIGPTKSLQIVRARKHWLHTIEAAEDLLKIGGIGHITVMKIAEKVRFGTK